MLRHLRGQKLIELSPKSMLGALLEYITFEGHKSFQPINSNWGIIEKENFDKKKRLSKEEKGIILSNKALDYIKEIKNGIFC